jgi:hypothetical protein
MRPSRLAFLFGLAFALVVSEPAHAKAIHESPYSYQQTFGSTVRLLKVDLGFVVTETDAEWGYVMFEYTSPESGDRKNLGSFTFVQVDDRVQVSLQIPSMPSYHEQVVIQKLRRKLEDEHGEPPRPPKKEPPKEPKEPKDPEPEPAG